MSLAKVLHLTSRRKRGNHHRAVWVVKCPCGHTNYFDALSWGGHRALRCKNKACRLFISKQYLTTGKTKQAALNTGRLSKLYAHLAKGETALESAPDKAAASSPA